MNKGKNKEIEETLSIKEFKDEPKPEKENTKDLDSAMKYRATGEALHAAGNIMWMLQFLGT